MSQVITNKWVFIRQSKCRGQVFYNRELNKFAVKRRCNICGQWITWETKNLLFWNDEAKDCHAQNVVWREGGTSSCEDWQHLRKKHFEDTFEEKDHARTQKAIKNFLYLKERGVIR